ncbi:hypothetical protein KORDIASMS9_02213 [Kordia sp. SMS9]|nr:hypothetical protein KORDIASMS9_02213 [Kordia sp. SMS9]
MTLHRNCIHSFQQNGFSVLDRMYSDTEIDTIIARIEKTSAELTLREKSTQVFAIRQVVKKIPALKSLFFTKNYTNELSGKTCKLFKRYTQF